MNYSIVNIAQIIDADFLQKSEDTLIENLIIDSRKIVTPNSSLFFALAGPRRSGSSFIKELYAKGIRNFVIDCQFDKSLINNYPQSNFLQVQNVTEALQKLACSHRNHFIIPTIGITGSNGKTIVKEWLFQLLHTTHKIVRSPKSYNSQIGVPLSVWQINKLHDLSIFEAGISTNNEMLNLQKIIQPTIGILTFIGEAHAEGFANLEEKISEKLKLFTTSDNLIYCNENAIVDSCVLNFQQVINPNLKLFTWSRNKPADLHIKQVEKKETETAIHSIYKDQSFSFTIPFTDEASIYNAITCCATLLFLSVTSTDIIKGMNELRPLEMRLELRKGNNQCAIINDSYSADYDSLKIALDFLSQQHLHNKKTLILSDLLQTGIVNEIFYEQIAQLINQKNLYRFIGIGPNITLHQTLFKNIPHVHFYQSTDEMINAINAIELRDETILLKGARVFEFEKITKIIEQKLHDTVLEINLNAIKDNLKIYRHQLDKNVKLMAMVKAFSYGSGSYEIAGILQNEGVEYLGVAYTDEGVELRKAGIRIPIMVMNTTNVSFDNIIQYELEPEIYSFAILHSFQHYLAERKIFNYPIHIKLDTGMHRLGFMPEEIDSLCNTFQNNQFFQIKSVFSHLVASENIIHDEYTQQQGLIFKSMANRIETVVGYTFIKHLANTSAIRRHPSLQYDMVRLGIGLYGVDEHLSLQNVTKLKTTIAQIKHLKKGDTVGYGRKGVLEQDSIIATVRIGYADGYPRNLSNGIGKMLVNGQMAPVIGNICMDMTMIDITGITADEGDEVIVFGTTPTVKTIANWAHTIPYEILTNISQRVKRIYFEE